jgi:hypothetical protein
MPVKAGVIPLMPRWLDRLHSLAVDPHAAVGGLVEAFEEVLDLSSHLLISHGLGRLVDVHHHGPLEVGDGARYRVYAVIVRALPWSPHSRTIRTIRAVSISLAQRFAIGTLEGSIHLNRKSFGVIHTFLLWLLASPDCQTFLQSCWFRPAVSLSRTIFAAVSGAPWLPHG